MNGFRKLLAASLSALLLLALWPASALAANFSKISVTYSGSGTFEDSGAPAYTLSLSTVEGYVPATVDNDLLVVVSQDDDTDAKSVTAALSGDDADSFTLDWETSSTLVESIAQGGDSDLTITPDAELTAGEYTAVVTLTSGEVESTVTLTVTVAPSLSLATGSGVAANSTTADDPMDYTVDYSLLVGYGEAQLTSKKTVTINTGTLPTAGQTLTAVVDPSSPDASKFAVALFDTDNVSASATNTLTVSLNDSYPVGTYKATINVTSSVEGVSPLEIAVTLTVTEAIALTAPSSGEIEFADTLIEGGYAETAATGVAETANKGLVTVENNSGASVYVKHSISGTGAAAFVLYKDSTGIDAKMTTDEKGGTKTVADGNSYSFWVVPAIDLEAGTYTANLTVTQVTAGGDQMDEPFTKTIPLTIEIKDATTTLEVTDVTLATIVKDAALPSPATITITNSGNSPATITGITLAGGENSPFQLGSAPSSAQTIAASGTYTTTTVVPKATTLAVGTYTDTIRVMNGEEVVAEGTVSFEIEAPDYTLDVTDVVIASQDAGGSQPGAATITITGVGNSATAISAITLKDGTNFTIGGTTTGTVSKAGTFTSATVQPKATIDYTKAGVYTDTIIVSYATGLQATGTVRFAIVEAGDATLASLAVTEGSLSPAFSAGTTAYTVHVASTVESIKVIPSANDTRATIKVGGATVSGGDASAAIALAAGTNAPITVTVTPNGGGDAKEYKITVIRSGSGSSGSGGSSSGSNGSNGSWPGDNYPPAPPPPAEVLPGIPGTSTPTTPSVTNPFSFRVLARNLNVRSGPGTSFAKVGTVRANDVISVVGYSADGLWAQTQAGSWVSLAYVSQVVSVDVGDYIVTVKSGSLNVRSGPGTSSAKIGSLANNALVMVNSVTGGWAQIEYNGGVGYVSVLYLR